MTKNGFPSKLLVPMILLAALVLASLGCNSIPFLAPTPTATATSTPTPTETPTRTSTPTVTQTFTPSLTPTQSYLDWPVVLSDPFDDGTHGWYEGSDNDEFLKGTVKISDGRYLVDITAVQPVFWALTPTIRNFSDFYLTVDVEKITGPSSSDYGLVFRINSDNKYYFAVAAESQEYHLAVLNNNEWTTIITWTSSSQINTSGPNKIGVLAKGASFTFFVNGEMVDQVDDSAIKIGKMGVGFSLYKAADKIQLAFDNFEVRAPKPGG